MDCLSKSIDNSFRMIMKPGNEAEASVPGKRGDYKPEIRASPYPGKKR